MKASFYEGGKVNNKLFAAIAEEATDVSLGELALLHQLVFYANEKGECWPRVSKLARHCHTSVRYARILMRRLIVKGYVRVKQEATPAASGVYLVRIPSPDDAGKFSVEVQNKSGVPLNKYRGRDVEKFRGTLIKYVPPQAGTNLNHNINNKRLTIKPDEGYCPTSGG